MLRIPTCFVAGLFLMFANLLAQLAPVEVASKTFKLGIEEESMYYAFEKGDVILFDFEVVSGKPAKEIEVLELPGSSKFMEWKCSKISGKRISVKEKGIFQFRFRNGGLGRKICRVVVNRIPLNESTKGFNPSIVWKTRYDTTWIPKTRLELESIDTLVTELVDRVERVHSQTNLENTNVSSFFVNFPRNKKEKLRTQKVISWAYWIGVGNAGNAAYEVARKDFLAQNASKVATLINPLAGLAVGAYAIAMNPPKGDNIHYWMTAYYQNGSEYSITTGNSVIAFGKDQKLLQGGFRVKLQNDNLMNGINVNVKITVVEEVRKYKEVHFQEPSVTSTEYPDYAD